MGEPTLSWCTHSTAKRAHVPLQNVYNIYFYFTFFLMFSVSIFQMCSTPTELLHTRTRSRPMSGYNTKWCCWQVLRFCLVHQGTACDAILVSGGRTTVVSRHRSQQSRAEHGNRTDTRQDNCSMTFTAFKVSLINCQSLPWFDCTDRSIALTRDI